MLALESRKEQGYSTCRMVQEPSREHARCVSSIRCMSTRWSCICTWKTFLGLPFWISGINSWKLKINDMVNGWGGCRRSMSSQIQTWTTNICLESIMEMCVYVCVMIFVYSRAGWMKDRLSNQLRYRYGKNSKDVSTFIVFLVVLLSSTFNSFDSLDA